MRQHAVRRRAQRIARGRRQRGAHQHRHLAQAQLRQRRPARLLRLFVVVVVIMIVAAMLTIAAAGCVLAQLQPGVGAGHQREQPAVHVRRRAAGGGFVAEQAEQGGGAGPGRRLAQRRQIHGRFRRAAQRGVRAERRQQVAARRGQRGIRRRRGFHPARSASPFAAYRCCFARLRGGSRTALCRAARGSRCRRRRRLRRRRAASPPRALR